MTITQLEYVVAVATYRSFVAAAEKSFVTQPTLSMQIQKLEEDLGIRLFDRTKQPIAVTDMGEEIVEQAKRILAECEKITDLVQVQQNKLSGVFRFAVIPTVAPYILPRLLDQYAAAYPEVKLHASEMETDKILIALRNGELDAAIVSTPLEQKHIREYPLFYEPFVAYFAPDEPALKKRLITPSDISLERIWLLSEGHCMRNQVFDLCSDHVEGLQQDRPYRYESSHVETLRKMVDSNGGLTILPELATHEFAEDFMERVRYFEEPQPVREIGIITTDHFAREALRKSLCDEVTKLVPESMRVQKKGRKVLRIQSAKL